MKKVPVVKYTTPDAAANLGGLPLQATVAMADVAAALRKGLLAFSTAAGLVVMQQMLTAELAEIVGGRHAKLGPARSGTGMARRPVRLCSVPARSALSGLVAVTSMVARSSWRRGRRSRRRTCCVRSWSSGCLPVWLPGGISKWLNRLARLRGRRCRSRRCLVVSLPRLRR